MARRNRLRFECAGITDRGIERDANEDGLVVRPDLGLFVVADGVSRSMAGALAAALAVREVERSYEASARRGGRGRPTSSAARGRIVRAFARAHATVIAAGQRHPRHAGMTTTLAAMVVARDRVVLAHVGDSRVYRLRGRDIDPSPQPRWAYDEVIERLTMDHSVAEDLAWRAAQPDDRTLSDPARRELLTRVIGADAPPVVTTRLVPVEPSDTLLLCTDGLHGVLPSSLLEVPLRCVGAARRVKGPAPALSQVQCNWLVDRVMQRKAPDNVTVVVARFKAGRDRGRTERGVGWVVHAAPPGSR